jgi:hypothetical protein
VFGPSEERTSTQCAWVGLVHHRPKIAVGQRPMSCPRNTCMFRRRSVGCFSRRSEPDWRYRRVYLDLRSKERATRKNSQLAAAQRVAMKMGRRLRCSSVTYRFRIRALLAPCRRPILIATKHARILGDRTYRCQCESHERTSFSPLAELLQERSSPELVYLETKFAALVSTGSSVKRR